MRITKQSTSSCPYYCTVWCYNQNTLLFVAVLYRFEPREIKARMDSPAVKSVLNMGYSPEIVRLAIQTKLSSTGLPLLHCFNSNCLMDSFVRFTVGIKQMETMI